MIAETKIEDRIKYANDMADAGYIPNEGPALYSHELVYKDNIARNLAQLREKRKAGREAEEHIDELLAKIESMTEIDRFVDKDSEGWTTRGKVLAGVAALVATGLLVVSNGGPGQAVENIKTFPQHIAYIYHRYVGENPDNHISPTTITDQDSGASG